MTGRPPGIWRVESLSLDASGKIAALVRDPRGFGWGVLAEVGKPWKITSAASVHVTPYVRERVRRTVMLHLIGLAVCKHSG